MTNVPKYTVRLSGVITESYEIFQKFKTFALLCDFLDNTV